MQIYLNFHKSTMFSVRYYIYYLVSKLVCSVMTLINVTMFLKIFNYYYHFLLEFVKNLILLWIV